MTDLLDGSTSFGFKGIPTLRFIDDTQNTLDFDFDYEEIVFPESIKALDDEGIFEASVDISRPRDYNLGLSDERSMAAVTANYSARMVRDEVKNEEIEELWDEKIYPNIVAQIEAIHKSSVCVINNSGPNYNPMTFLISGSITGVLLDTGSTITSYTRRVNYRISQRRRYRERFDGEEFTAIRYSPGRLIQAVVSVAYTELLRVGGKKRGKKGSQGLFGSGS